MTLRNIFAPLFRAGKNLGLLRWNFRLLFAFPIASLTIWLIGWSALTVHLEREKAHAEQEALEQARTMARGYAGELTQIVQYIDQMLLHVRHEWLLSEGTLRLEDLKETGLFPDNSLMNVMILDPNGQILTHTSPQFPRINLGDRPYFQAQKRTTDDSLYISTPVTSRVTGTNVIPFTRKLINANGEFAGLIVAIVHADHLISNHDRIPLGKYGFLGVIGGDGITRATRIGERVHAGATLGLTSLPGFDAPYGAELMSGKRTFIDNRNRYVGWGPADHYPLIALIGLDQEEVLAPYYSNAMAMQRMAYLSAIALAIMTVIAMIFSARLAYRKYQLETTRATYRMATEGGHEGFYIARPIIDGRNAIVDFELLDSNRRGAELLNRRREDIIGKRISAIYGSADTNRLIGILRQALRIGAYEGEVQVPKSSPFTANWVHVKILRSDGDLAIALRDISDSKAHVEELERRSNEDTLTGLPNRHWVQTYLPYAITRANESTSMLALLFIDLDGFKGVNDRMGHAAGDELLRNAAARLKDAVRPQDHVVRLGGDEFVVVLEHLSHKADAAHVAMRVRHAFREKFRLSQGEHSVGASIGISLFPTDGTDAETLLRHADVAMYSVKASGKGDFHFYDQKFYDALRVRLEQESELRQAIEQDQFVVYYQPRIDVQTGTMSSMEALVRWKHPAKGFISPIEFIPLAEETGLILGIGEIVIHKVCAQLAQWRLHGQTLVPVSINVSPRQFNEVDVPHLLSDALSRHHVDPSLVEIELTESVMMEDSPDISGDLAEIRRMGIKLLVDDFGTGYSSLSQLQRLDFDVLKVDRAFTAEIERSEKGNVFFKAIITMAHALGMRVVAEGVENEKQFRILSELDCDEIQGFYISEPIPGANAQPMLHRKMMPAAY